MRREFHSRINPILETIELFKTVSLPNRNTHLFLLLLLNDRPKKPTKERALMRDSVLRAFESAFKVEDAQDIVLRATMVGPEDQAQVEAFFKDKTEFKFDRSVIAAIESFVSDKIEETSKTETGETESLLNGMEQTRLRRIVDGLK